MSAYSKPNASNSITIRIKVDRNPATLGELTACIGRLNGQVGAIDIVEASGDFLVRDFTIDTTNEKHADQIIKAIGELRGIEIIAHSDRTFLLHLGGKIEIKSLIFVSPFVWIWMER